MNTPRTDVARWRLVCRFDQGGEYDANPKRDNEGEWVPVDVYTQLETELASMTALADRLAEALQLGLIIQRPGDIWSVDPSKIQQFFTGAKQALAAYESHKKQAP